MSRKRLTITLKTEVLRMLDNYIDGSRIRNRSHAIEYILSKQLFSGTVKILILAGGESIDFKVSDEKIPKSMIPIKNKPILEYTIENLSKSGLKDIIIATGYLGEEIENFFGDGSKWGVKITYSKDTNIDTGTVKPLFDVRKYIDNQTFIVIHGDILSEIDYVDLLDFHKSHKGYATMAVTSVKEPSNWGVAYMQGVKVVDFKEKPKTDVGSHLINAGVYVFDQKVFELLKKSQKNLSRDLFPLIIKSGNLYGYPFKGQWHDVGSKKDYNKAKKQWS